VYLTPPLKGFPLEIGYRRRGQVWYGILGFNVSSGTLNPSITYHTWTLRRYPISRGGGNPFSGGVKYTGWGKLTIFDENRRLSRKRFEIGRWLLWNVNRKSWVPDWMVSSSMTLSDRKPGFQGHCILRSWISKKRCVLGTKLLKNTNRKPYTVYRMVPLSMTLSDLCPWFQGHDIIRHWISQKRHGSHMTIGSHALYRIENDVLAPSICIFEVEYRKRQSYYCTRGKYLCYYVWWHWLTSKCVGGFVIISWASCTISCGLAPSKP